MIHYTDRRGRRRFKGGQRLKESQAYPIRFARAALGLPTHGDMLVKSLGFGGDSGSMSY